MAVSPGCQNKGGAAPWVASNNRSASSHSGGSWRLEDGVSASRAPPKPLGGESFRPLPASRDARCSVAAAAALQPLPPHGLRPALLCSCPDFLLTTGVSSSLSPGPHQPRRGLQAAGCTAPCPQLRSSYIDTGLRLMWPPVKMSWTHLPYKDFRPTGLGPTLMTSSQLS